MIRDSIILCGISILESQRERERERDILSKGNMFTAHLSGHVIVLSNIFFTPKIFLPYRGFYRGFYLAGAVNIFSPPSFVLFRF